jgi:hypothetical protein
MFTKLVYTFTLVTLHRSVTAPSKGTGEGSWKRIAPRTPVHRLYPRAWSWVVVELGVLEQKPKKTQVERGLRRAV